MPGSGYTSRWVSHEIAGGFCVSSVTVEQDSVSHDWCGALWTLLFHGLLLHGHLDLYVN